jgi:hypothetical protein
MRAVKFLIAILIVSPILILALGEPRLSRQPFAQITAAPGPVTLTAPVAPGQPQPFSTIGALPSLAAAPGFTPLGVASVAPTPRVFRCTCSAPGTWTEWAGVVSSSSYTLASTAAQSQCANYILNENAPSPYVPPETSAASQAVPQISNTIGSAYNQRSEIATSVGQTYLNFRSQAVLVQTKCTRCACN